MWIRIRLSLRRLSCVFRVLYCLLCKWDMVGNEELSLDHGIAKLHDNFLRKCALHGYRLFLLGGHCHIPEPHGMYCTIPICVFTLLAVKSTYSIRYADLNLQHLHLSVCLIGVHRIQPVEHLRPRTRHDTLHMHPLPRRIAIASMELTTTNRNPQRLLREHVGTTARRNKRRKRVRKRSSVLVVAFEEISFIEMQRMR